MKTILFNKHSTTPTVNYNKAIFENIVWSQNVFHSHHDISTALENKHPYTITMLIETLSFKLRNKKEYVQKTKVPTASRYKEILYDEFFKEYGQAEGSRIFSEWLKKYQPLWQKEQKYEFVDEYIIVNEFESRYRQKILAKFKNRDALFKDRFETVKRRYYNLPEPLNYLDYRNSYDNIFVWQEASQKVARRGGSGASGSRETNSMFILGLLELSQKQPVSSYLFIYSDENKLLFVKKFDYLCVPMYDIGSNYWLENEEVEKLKRNGTFLRWIDSGKIDGIETVTKDTVLNNFDSTATDYI